MRPLWIIAALLLSIGVSAPAHAHEIRPALLDITETSPGWFDVTWKVPMRGDMVLALEPVLPTSMEPAGPPAVRMIPGANVQRLTCRVDEAAGGGDRRRVDLHRRPVGAADRRAPENRTGRRHEPFGDPAAVIADLRDSRTGFQGRGGVVLHADGRHAHP